ncbi:PTS system mannose/fructose/N-acetylgalactosamine-transporter subunit IIB [Carnobacterium gallinarum]|uniref:PTS system mannose/fructose/N-acetylgalactosamine-transporter subunit IIB n=1 Tax=Carnobacterium gallinarum TaxID=2749 RepID=UPI00054FC2F1|nr:PTS sugar transporter subunit IIB [Carnobacterium gallinarum]
MPITLVRVDDRVIHGQIATRWAKYRNCDGILVADDQIAADPFRSKVLKAAAPTGVKVGIYTLEEALEKIEKAKVAKNSYFLISNSPLNFQKLLELGADFGTELNIGPMNTRPNTKILGKTVAIDEADYQAFDSIESNGVKVSFQLLPDDSATPWSKLKAKYDQM